MIKYANDLEPGDVVCLGLGGPQMIVAIKPISNGVAIVCDCGEKAIIPYDCKMYVYCNPDEQLQLAHERERLERERIARQVEARARRNRELVAQGKRNSEMWYGIS